VNSEGRHTVYLGLGSNLGDRNANIKQSIALINERVGEVIRQSSFIETEPWGFQSKNAFLNAVVLCETTLTPRQLLKTTQKIERELGKTKVHATRRKDYSLFTNHYSLYKDRPIDIDILLYDDLVIDEPDLKIPHPLMHQRDFVMIPLNEIRQ
jgi:2-amino-4-hydroxy-6-hydroxymethyldihydropteridine diphosphokinase